ncbi:hypothetical protein FHR81_003579 [Actinoalloteichus hoggarensis]|uniref:Uncharacterized protein n=1 Tax=Actinoalloteichus hoggarensis TaxID=1470176 RepID=A0A221WA28_9PSEU|nr:class I SAM-dependent methyltransferase [Actinoalloteichus hoggarensis]ASO22918.1 hypothetical protein AHOG_26580 [Actinoalloteichus hoggarensis]MBB5922522.1 hypothetical protein [Actinoalloteichus hoggarensis]
MSAHYCRYCDAGGLEVVLDLGDQPACDDFPLLTDTRPDPLYSLRMGMCTACGLAQLLEDDTTADEPRGIESHALVRQSEQAVARAAAAGLLPKSGRFAEFGSPHGGSWAGPLSDRGLIPAEPGEPADLVLDCFGLMHEPAQAAALARRVDRLAEGGTLLVQFHSLAAMLRDGEWNVLRHGHHAYYSTPVLVNMLETVGLVVRRAWTFDLYGGTVLLACTREGRQSDGVTALVREERAFGVLDAGQVGRLQLAMERGALELWSWLEQASGSGLRILGYGAASRSVALLCAAGAGPGLLPAVVDAAESKHGRRLPGVGIPVVGPERLRGDRPDLVLLFVPDLLAEVRAAYPEVEAAGGRWVRADHIGLGIRVPLARGAEPSVLEMRES